jgi:hypothetical protein
MLPQGVLYEDTFLQVSLRASYTGSSGGLQLSLFNKATMPLHNLVLMAGVPHTALQLQMAAAPPPQLGPRAHAQVCMDASASPALVFSGTLGREFPSVSLHQFHCISFDRQFQCIWQHMVLNTFAC